MSKNDVEKKVAEVFAEVLSADVAAEREQLVYGVYRGWDSVAHMALVAALEDKFDCMLEMDDVLDLSSFDKGVAIMGKHG